VTRRTVESDCYPGEIRKRRPDIHVVQQACPELAGSIEQGVGRGELRDMVRRYVGELLGRIGTAPESVILGCTHYPLVADLFSEALPPGVRMIHQPSATARALREYLDRHPEYGGACGGRRTFLSTGFSAEALPLIERFWGGPVPFEEVVEKTK
jgi:glutamate racemase